MKKQKNTLKVTLKVTGKPLVGQKQTNSASSSLPVTSEASYRAILSFGKFFKDGSARTRTSWNLRDSAALQGYWIFCFLLRSNGQVVADCDPWTISSNNLSAGLY